LISDFKRSGDQGLDSQLLDFVDDVVDELGSRDQISYVHQILKMELERKQLAVFE
jgi:carboxylate-amine ligase